MSQSSSPPIAARFEISGENYGGGWFVYHFDVWFNGDRDRDNDEDNSCLIEHGLNAVDLDVINAMAFGLPFSVTLGHDEYGSGDGFITLTRREENGMLELTQLAREIYVQIPAAVHQFSISRLAGVLRQAHVPPHP